MSLIAVPCNPPDTGVAFPLSHGIGFTWPFDIPQPAPGEAPSGAIAARPSDWGSWQYTMQHPTPFALSPFTSLFQYQRPSPLGDLCVDAAGNEVACGESSGGPSNGGFWDTISNLVNTWSTTGQKILTAQNLPRGVYTQTGPGGTVTYVQPSGSNVTLPVGAGTLQASANTGFGMVLIAGAAVLVLFMLMRRK